ncbi:MAG: DUF192 domain-containing protein [Candidatus Dojkabacteria bacterium]|jgi:uncharacterized membrane protein (UPF0127 family)
MNSSLKILLYIFFVVAIFYFVQEKFHIFDIRVSDRKEGVERVNESKDGEKMEVYNRDGNPILVSVDIADTASKRMQGLSGRQNLGDYEGMLFIMDDEGFSSFWMKEMLIPLDILFIDSKGFIVDIKENLQPCEGNICPAINSNEKFKYALELNAGFAEQNRVEIGNSCIFEISSSD